MCRHTTRFTRHTFTHIIYLRPLTTHTLQVTRTLSAAPFVPLLVALRQSPSLPVIMASTLSPPPSRPQTNNRHPTAPSVMTVNGHFASANEKPTAGQYEHGMQVINEDQEFKYVSRMGNGQLPLGPSFVLTTHTLKLESPILSIFRKGRASWLQLPPYLRLWLAIYGQVNTTEPPLRYRLRCHVRIRAKTNDKRHMDVEG